MAMVEGTRRQFYVLMSVLTLFTSPTSSGAPTSMATFDYFYNWSIPTSLLQPVSVATTTSKLRCASMCGLTPGCQGFVLSCETSHPADTCACHVSLSVNVSSGYPSTGSIVGLLVEGGLGPFGCGLRPTVLQRTAVTYTGTNHGDVANYSCRYASDVYVKGTTTISCINGEWQIPTILCAPTTCWYTHWIWGQVYKGTLATTENGLECMSWSSDSPHMKTIHYQSDDSYTVDGSKAAASNYCRAFNDGFPVVWCYTMNPSERWLNCSVPACPPS